MSSTETEQPKSGLENIKILNAMNQKDGVISTLVLSISATRKKLDAAVQAEREKLKAAERVRREAKAAEEAEKREAILTATPQEPPPSQKSAPPAKPAPPQKAEPTKKPAAEPATRTLMRDPSPTPNYVRGVRTPPPSTAASAQGRHGSPRPDFRNSGAGSTSPRSPAPPRNPAPLKAGAGPSASSVLSSGTTRKFDTKKKDHQKAGDDKKGMTKRTLIRKGFIAQSFDEDRVGFRKLKNKKRHEAVAPGVIKIEKAVITTENLTVKILSEKIGKTAQEIIKQLMVLGIMTTINSVVDFSTMELVANELGVELELKIDKTKEELLEEVHEEQDKEEELVKRPPVITVMGHVDHGKTSLLDRIRKTSVVTGEAGGITQHIGAYSVLHGEEQITFLDTPGHEAFTHMRSRGARVTDIAVLVVAADDGIMPQTIEAVNHAKAASVPVIVAINKIDKPSANIPKIREMLTEHGLVAEEWGGDTMIVPISAKTGEGIDKLLESILLLAEVNTYRANPKRAARGTVIEARLDKGRGPVANVMIQNGTLRVGDTVVSGTTVGRVRAMTDDKGRSVQEAGPSSPVSVLGFTEVPAAGDAVLAVADEKTARQVAGERIAKIRIEQIASGQKITLDDILSRTGEVKIKDLTVIIKADVQGSAEALKSSLEKLANEEARVKVVHAGVGAVTKSDIMLAEVSKALIIAFGVRVDADCKNEAESAGIEVKSYRVIYEAIEEVSALLNGMLTPKYKETVTGRAEVRNIFKITGSGMVAGSYVLSGKIYRNSLVRIIRADETVFEGTLKGLKHFKEDVKEMAAGYECGISVNDFADIKELDIIEAYSLEQIPN
ncbi:MAG: translation initiation factor IF-2 [Firmicutes bacterium]|nr:translation initiation factor IF-2 [Bacillota bacterium]